MTFGDFVKNKRIAVVGPGPSVVGTNQGHLIDSYDLVMRFNTAVPVRDDIKKDVGTKTDILCTCLEEHPVSGGHIDPQMWAQNGVKWVLSAYPKLSYTKANIDRFVKLNRGSTNLEIFDMMTFRNLEKTLNTRPNSGLLGMIHLLRFDIKELYVTGITFGRGGYHKGYKDDISAAEYNKLANGRWHKQKPQEDYFKGLYKKDKRIKPDQALKDILEA